MCLSVCLFARYVYPHHLILIYQVWHDITYHGEESPQGVDRLSLKIYGTVFHGANPNGLAPWGLGAQKVLDGAPSHTGVKSLLFSQSLGLEGMLHCL